MRLREKVEDHNGRAAALAMLMAIGLITTNGGSLSSHYPPYNFLPRHHTSTASDRFPSLFSHSRMDIADLDATNGPKRGGKPLVIVMVIGESARSDHLSINGYSRETTPLMAKRTHLINFKDTTACWCMDAYRRTLHSYTAQQLKIRKHSLYRNVADKSF